MLPFIVACEIAFWIVLALGLLARYGQGRARLGAALLLAVPLVDVALLVLTYVDLRSGATPNFSHGLAAAYLGFSVAFGHDLVRWADVRVAHRFRGGPPPPPVPRSGTRARARKEWRDFLLALLGAGLTTGLLVLLTAATAPGTDDTALLWPLPKLAVILTIWFLGWPAWETVRVALRPAGPVMGEVSRRRGRAR